MSAFTRLAKIVLLATAVCLLVQKEGRAQTSLADLLGLGATSDIDPNVIASSVPTTSDASQADDSNHAANDGGDGHSHGSAGGSGHCPSPTFTHTPVSCCCKPVLNPCQLAGIGSGGASITNVTVNVINITINITINIFINVPSASTVCL